MAKDINFKEFLKEMEGGKMLKEDYNGWSNYATWRVNLELFNDDQEHYIETYGKDVNELAEGLESEVDEFVESNVTNTTISGWVNAFLQDVDYREIAEGMIDEWTMNNPDDEEPEEDEYA